MSVTVSLSEGVRRLCQTPVGLGLGRSARIVQPGASKDVASSRFGRFAPAHHPLKQVETRLAATQCCVLI
jgi:hypothetical protein